MKPKFRAHVTAVTVLVVIGVSGLVLVDRILAQAAQKVAAAKPQTAGEYFKNVTTPLKELSVHDFLSSMGVISADLGLDCADCHTAAGTDNADWVVDTPRKKTARRMIEMVAGINRNNFGGAQAVTCFSCHHRNLRPASTIGLDALYGPPSEDKDAVVGAAPDAPSAEQVINKYIEALGGARRLADLRSFVATGKSVGYGGIGGSGTFQILAKAPDQRTALTEFKDHPERGDGIRAYNGRTGWIKAPRNLVKEHDAEGGELDGMRLDAQLAFPGQIRQVLKNLRSGAPETIGGKDFDVVQGTSSEGLLVTLYFNQDSGLLTRYVRYGKSPVGRIPTQFDFADYREVGGVKFPFKITFSWLDGKDAYQLNDVTTNVPIEPAKFERPRLTQP